MEDETWDNSKVKLNTLITHTSTIRPIIPEEKILLRRVHHKLKFKNSISFFIDFWLIISQYTLGAKYTNLKNHRFLNLYCN